MGKKVIYFAIPLVLAFAIELFLSEALTGWARKYTSPIYFTPKSIPDMAGKVAIVTGSNTGIGYITALELARAGADVIVAARSQSKGLGAVSRIKDEIRPQCQQLEKCGSVQFLSLDLASLDSVKKFVKSFQELKLDLHLLVLNAGVMKSPGQQFVGEAMTYGFDITEDGFEYHIGVNHIGHAYLTQLLLDKLKSSAAKSPDGSRIVSVSSSAETSAPEAGIVFNDWRPENGIMPVHYEDGASYGQSKLANLMYANELALHLNGTGVSVYACHPGIIDTELSRYMNPVIEESVSKRGPAVRFFTRIFLCIFRSVMFDTKGGALTQLHLSTGPKESLVNGAFYHPVGRVVRPMHPQGDNETLRKLLWDETHDAIKSRSRYRFKN